LFLSTLRAKRILAKASSTDQRSGRQIAPCSDTNVAFRHDSQGDQVNRSTAAMNQQKSWIEWDLSDRSAALADAGVFHP
jgi:hypothetical protein